MPGKGLIHPYKNTTGPLNHNIHFQVLFLWELMITEFCQQPLTLRRWPDPGLWLNNKMWPQNKRMFYAVIE